MVKCPYGGDCYRNQCVSKGECHLRPDNPEHSLHCPETRLHCYDPLCRKDFCLRKDRRQEPTTPSERQWENIMEQLEQNIFYEKKKEIPAAAEKLIHIIAEQVGIIDRLTRNEKCHEGSARYLGVTAMTGTLINSVQFFNVKSNKHMSVSFKKAGGAIATLTAFAADGVTPAPNGVDLTKPITALSNHPEFFTAAIVVDANNVPTIPLQAKLTGVDDGVGTITYAATSIDGSAIVLVDNVIVADVPPIVPAASFTVEYTVF